MSISKLLQYLIYLGGQKPGLGMTSQLSDLSVDESSCTCCLALFKAACIVVRTYHMNNGNCTIAGFLCIYVKQYYVYD